jgi:predicted DNA-binding transcriptional regulator YafY
MARNTELIRQWEILREIDAARTGIAIARLAEHRHVHPRTIRRDLEALARAGFPLFDEKVTGTSMWKLSARPFRGLEQIGLSAMELAALYFGRTLLASAGVTPLAEEMSRAFTKLESALPEATKKFLNRLPVMVKAKTLGRRKHDGRKLRDVVTRITEASLAHRRVEMTYHSASSQKTKTYIVDPLRLTAADGGMYLTAWVEAYDEMRTFAVERIRKLGVRDDHFELRPLPSEPFANSLGVFSGSPEVIEIEFDPEVADYVASREWHRSQTTFVQEDGSLVMQLVVCNDRPLRTWILGFGGRAHVLAPRSLARDIYEEFDAGRDRYTPRLPFDSPFDSLSSLRGADRLASLRTDRQLKMWGDADEMRLPFARRA